MEQVAVEIEIWRTVMDGRECEFCAYLHGTVFPKDEGLIPPEHEKCRCRRQRVETRRLTPERRIQLGRVAAQNASRADEIRDAAWAAARAAREGLGPVARNPARQPGGDPRTPAPRWLPIPPIIDLREERTAEELVQGQSDTLGGALQRASDSLMVQLNRVGAVVFRDEPPSKGGSSGGGGGSGFGGRNGRPP